VKGLLIACFQTLKSTGGWGIFKWPQVGDFGWPPGLIALIGKYAISRQKIHDMNIVATMIDNNISHLLTYNVKDFRQINEIQLVL